MSQSYYIRYQGGYANKGIAKFGNMETPAENRIRKLLFDFRCQENYIKIDYHLTRSREVINNKQDFQHAGDR